MNNSLPFILISNDDGYRSKGLRSLVEMLNDMANIIVVAPDSGRSGFSCAFSAAVPLRIKQQEKIENAEIWSCTGTPADCVKIGLDRFFSQQKPHLIIGGINHGDNASVNTHYSGTMGIAIEGCMKGVSSIGFSLANFDEDADFSPLRPYIRSIVAHVLAQPLPQGVCLNVNFPATPAYNGVKVCRMAKGTWCNECVTREHPYHYEYIWMVGKYHNEEPDADDTDHWALTHNYVAITPTHVDVTAYHAMQVLKYLEQI